MAVYPNQTFEGNIGKTHTNLVVSEGAAPAEEFIVSKTNDAEPFLYEYGPEGNQVVKLAKGKIVEAVGEEVNRVTRKHETAIKQAGELSTRVIGVNHHNVTEASLSARGGDFNRPTVITRDYIEVPLFEATDAKAAAATAKAMRFGAAYAEKNGIKSGDFVGAGEDGNFRVLTKEEIVADPRVIVGQVLSVKRDLPPSGLLQYYTGLTNAAEIESYLSALNATGTVAPYGTTYSLGSWRADFLKELGYGKLTGIPFLTDGYFSAIEKVTAKIDDAENIAAAKGSDNVAVEGANVTVTVANGEVDGTLYVKMKHNLDRRAVQDITVKSDEGAIPVKDINVDVNNNTIVVFLDEGTYANVTVTADCVVNPTAGIPTEWDYKGSVGAVRILLQR